MFAIEPGCLDSSDEELRSVGVFAGIRHAQPARAVVLQLEVLVGETVTIDALAWAERDQLNVYIITANHREIIHLQSHNTLCWCGAVLL